MNNLVKFALAAMAFSSFHSFANECELSIESNDMMQFSKKTLSVSSKCEQVKLTLIHTGKLPAATMGHNWVLTEKRMLKQSPPMACELVLRITM